MSKQSKGNEKQQNLNSAGSGSEYHKKHAGNIEGYGEPHPSTAELSITDNNLK